MAPRATRRSTAAAAAAAKKNSTAKTKAKAKATPKSKSKNGEDTPADDDTALIDGDNDNDNDSDINEGADTDTHPDPKVFILPSSPSSETATASPADLILITLPHPATQSPTRYLLHSTSGIHEIKKISYSLSEPRSWLVVPAPAAASTPVCTEEPTPTPSSPNESDWVGKGQVIPDSSVYLCTPMDPLFLILHHLTSPNTSKNYLPMDDILEPLLDDTTFHWNKALQQGSKSEEMIKSRIVAVCDSIDAGGEQVFRVNMTKLLSLLAKKCKRMAGGKSKKGGLPQTIEEEYVRKVLAKPLGTTASSSLMTKSPSEDHTDAKPIDQAPSESLSALTITSSSSAPPAFIVPLQRLLVSSTYLSTYLPPTLPPLLTAHLNTLHDFTPLNTYLSELSKLKSDLTFSRAGDFSIKKSSLENEEEADSKRKRKREEEEEEKKRKKNMSSGVKALKKVNTQGMMKMTSFFKKKE